MKSRYYINMIILMALLIPFRFSSAQTQPIPLTFGGTFYGNYSYTVDGIEGKDANKFDLDRFYFTMKAQFAEDLKMQMTTDLYRNSSAGSYYGGLAIRMKFAFIDYTPAPYLSIKMGLVPGPWNGSVEAQWKYRGVASTASDKYGYVPTADLGASVTYTLPEKYGEVAAYLLNGEGFTAPEANRFKDVVLRGTFTPFPANDLLKSFTVGGYSYLGTTGTKDALKRQRFGGLLGYSYSFASIGAEYDQRRDTPVNPDTVLTGDVFSIFGEIKAPFAGLDKKLSLIWRYDIVEPNKDKGKDMTRFLILGLSYKLSDKLTFVLDRQDVIAESASIKQSAGTYIDKDQKWFVHAIVTF